MAEILLSGFASDFVLSTAVSALGATVRAIKEVYNAVPLRQENRRAVAELDRILAFLGPALTDISARAAQFASASLPALGENTIASQPPRCVQIVRITSQ